MMATNLFLVFLLTVTSTYAMSRISMIQAPMPGIQIPQIFGNWYSQFRKPPCSWSGSKQFSNTQTFFQFEGKKISLQLTYGYGNKICSRIYGQFQLSPTPGVLLLKDYFGDVLSGKFVIIATDYVDFIVWWGCTKFSVFGDVCDDPFIFVQTRTPKVSMKTISKINSVLMQRFGITIQALDHHVVHNGACSAGKKMPFVG